MRSSSCVCRQWNALADIKKLRQRRDYLNLTESISLRKSFTFINPGQGKYISPRGICSGLNDQEVLITDGNPSKVRIFNQDGNYISSFACDWDHLNSPMGIFTRGSNVFVSDHGNKRIQVYNHDYNPSSSIDLGSYYPSDICGSRQGNILVTTHRPGFLIMDPNGTVIREVTLAGNEILGHSYGIATNSLDQIVVSDTWNHKILIFEKDGNFISPFGSRGRNTSQFESVYGIYIDQQDNIFVSDFGNSRVSIFSHDGMPIDQISTNGHSRVSCVIGRRLFIGCEENILIYSNKYL